MASEENDTELVARAKAGDQTAFRSLHDRYAQRVRAFVRRRLPGALRRRVSDSDIIQETFTAAFGALADFEPEDEGAFARWLGKIADRKLNEAARRHFGADKRAVARELSRSARPDTTQLPGRGHSPSAEAIAKETDEALARTLASLPEDYRAVLRLIHEEGLTLAQAGERMGRSAEAVRKLYGRAAGKLSEGVFDE